MSFLPHPQKLQQMPFWFPIQQLLRVKLFCALVSSFENETMVISEVLFGKQHKFSTRLDSGGRKVTML